MIARDIRKSFLRYFERHDHRIVPSASLVPADDPTLLFTNAGMNQFKDVFLGRERRDYRRATTAQKCMRVSGKHNDLDNVGPSLRHHTFFEMLGNFSFGDYFKEEAITLAWTLLTDEWGLDAARLHPTIFGGEAGIPRDDEAHATWRTLVPPERIIELGVAENFWSMGETGPSGRCSEVHYFRGNDIPCPEPRCQGLNCRCDRFVEIWNNVFMEFDRQADGRLEPLPAPSIDTGMGLERIAAVMQGTGSNYDTDLFGPLLRAIGDRARIAYGGGEADVSLRVVADHVRATTFLIADGVVPSNEWRGYVLRKIMRRAMRHGMRLGLSDPFLYELVDVVVAEMGDAYPELRSHRDAVVQVVRAEEQRFDAVLTTGLGRLEEVLDRAAAGDGVVPGQEVFRLYDSLGLPVDFIEDLAGERQLQVDRPGFERALEGQRVRARAGSTFGARGTPEFSYASEATQTRLHGLDAGFEGYATTHLTGVPIAALFDDERHQVDALREGDDGYVVLERTPFYLESGGQVSDVGRLSGETTGAAATVDAVAALTPGGPRAHHVQVTSGSLSEGDVLEVIVDAATRDATRRNHTATHLLHAALRQELGSHVTQAGSLVAPDRLRFDFVHGSPVGSAQLMAIEQRVNEQIRANHTVETTIQSTQEAIAAGAMALFGEKYSDQVRVVTVPDVSMELCGGTHCRATGDIGLFAITQETSVAAGVRRIDALTGADAVRHVQRLRRQLDALLDALGVPVDQARAAVERLQAEVKRLGRELNHLKMRAALGTTDPATSDIEQLGDIRFQARRVEGMDPTALRELADSLKGRLGGDGTVVLASEHDGKVAIVVSVSKALTPRVHAGRVVQAIAPIVDGGGGGRPDFAQAGGRDPSKIQALLDEARTVVTRMLQVAQ
jgi:alanyl-tRNA synthetase